MKWGILGALDAEVALILEHIEAEKSESMLGTTFVSGKIGSTAVVVACCNPGTVNAAVIATVLLERYQVDCIVNVGIAGSMDPKLRLLDVVISDRVVYHDRDTILEKFYPGTLSFDAGAELVSLCMQACEGLTQRSFQYYVGLVASGDWFIQDQEVKKTIKKQCDPVCVEMEGAAIGQVCTMYGKPFLVIRSISDNANDEASETYDNWMDLAAEQSAQIVLKMLELI